jgi:hypothetical protein
MRVLTQAVLVAAALAAGLAAASAAPARRGIVPGTDHKGRAAFPAKASGLKLLSSIFGEGEPGTSIVSGFTTFDTHTVTCPKSACLVEIDIEDGVIGYSSTPVQWAICGQVDELFADEGCPYAGEIPADGTPVAGHAHQLFSVAQGQHAVGAQTYLESGGAFQGIYYVSYRVYAY